MVIKKTVANLELNNRKTHVFRLLALTALFFYLLILFTHRFWLPFVADFLVLQNHSRHADLIVVATPFRPRFLHALNLMQKGYADQILLVGDTRIKMLWSGKTSVELAKNEAVKRGISQSIIHAKHSTGTRVDALQTKLLMISLGLKSALVISDPYNMRRLKMIFDHVFKGSGMKLAFAPTDQKRPSPDYWWLSPHSFVYVIKEWIKLPMNYYLLSFRPYKDVKPSEVPEEKIPEEFTEPKLEFDNILSKDSPHNLFRFFKFKIGEFLVVDENDIRTDAIITPVLSSRVSLNYKKGHHKKVFLFNGLSDYTRENMAKKKVLAEIYNKARKLGIDSEDLIMVPHILGDAYQTTHFLNRFMGENNLNSASIYLPYYETQKFQFYFKRFLNPGFTVQITPLETSYRHLLGQWLQNTGLGNLYLDQYLIMTHYYFNKFLWSSRA